MYDGVKCRIFGHAWEEVPIGKVVDDYSPVMGYRVVIAVQCLRCKTARVDAWNQWGGIGGRRYIYDDDYKTLNADLREHGKEGDNSWITAKKRYIAARKKEAAEREEAAG